MPKITITRLKDKDNNIVLSFGDILLDGTAYNVELSIKNRDVLLGEVDFCKWEDRSDFKVVITPQKEPIVSLNSTDRNYRRVLEYLRLYAKFTLTPGLMPDKKLVENVAVGKSWNPFSKTVSEFDPSDSQKDLLENEEYAKAIKKIKNLEVEEGYYNALKNSLNVKIEKFRKERRNYWIRLVLITIAVIFVAAILVVLSIYLPPVAAALIGLTTNVISAFLSSTAGLALILGGSLISYILGRLGVIKIPGVNKKATGEEEVSKLEAKVKNADIELSRITKEIEKNKKSLEKMPAEEKLVGLLDGSKPVFADKFMSEYNQIKDINKFVSLFSGKPQLINALRKTLLEYLGTEDTLKFEALKSLNKERLMPLLKLCLPGEAAADLIYNMLDLLSKNKYEENSSKRLFQDVAHAVYKAIKESSESQEISDAWSVNATSKYTKDLQGEGQNPIVDLLNGLRSLFERKPPAAVVVEHRPVQQRPVQQLPTRRPAPAGQQPSPSRAESASLQQPKK